MSYSLHGHSTPEPVGLEWLQSSIAGIGYKTRILGRYELEVIAGKDRISFISGITSEWQNVIGVARNAKKRGNKTIVGGYHVSGLKGDIEENLFDFAVIGEGEEISVVISSFMETSDKELISLYDIGFALGGARILKAPSIEDLDSLPFPHRNERFLSEYKICDWMWPSASEQRNAALVLGSRGCVYKCDFCASSTVWGQGIRFRSTGKIVEELRDLKDRFGTNTVVFIDQSLGQGKQWTLELCRAIQEADLGINWYHQSNLTIDRETLKAMADAGCTKIGFGVEGISPATMRIIKPTNPSDYEAINETFDYCNSLGMFVKAYLMLGFPWETQDTIRGYFDSVTRIRANQLKISFMTIWPGTRDWEKYSGQLVTKNWEDFDTVRMPVVKNPRISVERYHKIRQELFRAFYGSPVYMEITKSMLDRYPYYSESYREFVGYLRSFRMVSGDEAWLKWVDG